ncbi:MAG: hypothetical protein RIS52_904 [Pseudomonadota bacterium]
MFLVTYAHPDEAQLRTLIETGPVAKAVLIANLTVRNWNPTFGCFNAQSSLVVMFGQG